MDPILLALLVGVAIGVLGTSVLAILLSAIEEDRR